MYTVTPDEDNYYPSIKCHNCHSLQHYLLNITKYFTSNTQLLFLPGQHHLNTDLIIQDVHNISLIGSTANGTTLDTIIIQCNSSFGIAMSNITNLTMVKLEIKKCRIQNNFLNINRLTFVGLGMVLSHCYNIYLQNITVYKSTNFYKCNILVINVLGISSFINVSIHGIMIEYNDKINFENIHNKMLLENYHILPPGGPIRINLLQKTYKVELEFCNVKFVSLNATVNIEQSENEFGNFIHFNQCTIENYNSKHNSFCVASSFSPISMVIRIASYYKMFITFTNCLLQYNKFHRFLRVSGTMDIKLEGCIFKYNQFQVIKWTDTSRSFLSTITISNTLFYEITCNVDLVSASNIYIYLKGPVIFSLLKVNKIFALNIHSTINCQKYIEFSNNLVSFNDRIPYITVQQNTLINMSNNTYNALDEITDSISKFTSPCYYQYTAEGQNFDKSIEKINVSIVFHSDLSVHGLRTTHCRWLPNSAFNATKPIDINNAIIAIESNFHLRLINDKMVCHCYNSTQYQDCSTDTLATVYPGQSVSLSLILNYLYPTNGDNIGWIKNQIFSFEINDDILPPTACKIANINEVIQEISYHSCTVINFTVVHNGINNLQWCELFIKIISTHDIDAYYINMQPCPTGFAYQSGVCNCDPILKSILQITLCDINYQTILRPPGSWLSAVTINESHQYHISPHCPLHYCLPRSSQLYFSTPNSQCQFNRSDLLCGHCQQGLSTVFGYPHCQHCSNGYLLLVIPIAVAGLVLVLLLFFLNLTVTNGDVNGFILYVNVVSINTDIFFVQYNNYNNLAYTFISLGNLDLGIPVCFYNGMDDYAKMWLQLAFPAYLILIAILLIIASRYSTKVQRITARRALPVLATLFLLSYTKVLRTVSSVLFYYSTITHLPSGHTTLVWAVDANVPLFGLKFTVLFIVCLILFVILLSFNAVLCFTKTAMRLHSVNHFKPLIDAYQGPYNYKCYYWTGLMLIIRAIFFGLSALDTNINLTIGVILLVVVALIQRSLIPFKDKWKNLHEISYILNLSTIYVLSFGHYKVPINIMITIAALQFSLIILHHSINNICGGVIMYKLKNFIEMTKKWVTRSQNIPEHHIELKNIPPDKIYNYQELRDSLIGQD